MAAALRALLFLFCSGILAYADPDSLQDFCIANANNNSALLVNGASCTAGEPSSDDFTSTLLRGIQQVNTSGKIQITRVSVSNFPALNTQGLAVNRADLGPGAVNTPHVHPRASELIYVVEGVVQAGFVDTNNKLWLKTLQKGDLFSIPKGLVHFQYNAGSTPATVIAMFNSQNPGVQRMETTLFGSGIPDAVLTASFQMNQSVISDLKKKFTP